MMRKIALVFVGLLFVAAPAMARAPHHRAAPQNHAQPPAANQPSLIPFAGTGNGEPMDSVGESPEGGAQQSPTVPLPHEWTFQQQINLELRQMRRDAIIECGTYSPFPDCGTSPPILTDA